MSLDGAVALVTGASEGLGKAIATRLVDDGARVAILARTESRLMQTASELDARTGTSVLPVVADVSRPADVEHAVNTVRDRFGRIDILVCNAGVYGPTGLIEDVDWDEWAHAIDINLNGTVLCCRAVVPLMRKQGRGKIITLSGGGATRGLPRLSAYAASKAAVVRFVETLALELEGTEIDVNSVAPGALNTRLLDQILEAGPERVGQRFYEQSVRQKRDGGTPLATGADLVAFLASRDSDGITGRLLAAVWDDWRNLPSRREQLAESDVYMLRRIIPEERGWSQP